MRDRINKVFSNTPRAQTNDEHEAVFDAIDAHDPDRAQAQMRSPIQFSGAELSLERPSPRLGEHTSEVLAELGLAR